MSAWSYSAIKTFEQCPKKYYHLKVAQDVEDTPGEAALYGTSVHLAAEKFIRDGEPVPKKFEFIRPSLTYLASLPGKKHCELPLGVTADLDPCGFDDPQAWYRGIIDLLVVNNDRAWLVDYKTGKSARYADVRQLDLMAGAVFCHFPKVKRIKSCLLFLVSGELVSKTHRAEDKAGYLRVFEDELARLGAAKEHGVFNPQSGPLCGYCPVVSCPHWRRRFG